MPRRNNHVKLERFLNSPQTCGQKRRYRTQTEAEHIREEQELLTPGLRLRTYKCSVPGCGGWHLTRTIDTEDVL